MWSSIKRLLTAPTFPDKEKTRAARWINFIALVLITLIVGDSIGIILGILDQNALAQILITNAIALVASLLVLGLMRRGHVTIAAFILLAMLFAALTYMNAFVFQSIRTPNIMTYFVLIPLAGLLAGRRNMNILAVICVLTISIIFYLEWKNILTPNVSGRSIFDDLVVLFFTIALNTVLLNAAIQRVEEKAEEIRQTAAALATANQELQTSQFQLRQARAGLEQKVELRTQELQQSNVQLQSEVETRQRLLDALARSEANWRSLAEQLPEVIVRINREHVISFVNREIGNRTPEDLLGVPATSLHIQAKHQALLQQSIATVFRTGETVSYESEEITAERHTWQINRVGAIRQDGKVRAVILISTDITEQKQTEAAMYQMQKLESLGILAGGVAHDFNNLLSAILMQMSLALRKLPTEHPVVTYIQRTMKAAERATELTRQMLNYAGRSTSETILLDLNDLIMDNVHLFSASIAKNVVLHSELSDTVPLMMGDKGQIQQLIMNLILNSADAIGEKAGEITVVTKTEELAGDEAHYLRWLGTPLPAGRYVRLEVRDTGSGMDAQTLTKIFDPFFTTKFTGRGLGLASLIGIVRSHKGGLHVSSTVGRGTTFILLFPAVTDTSQLHGPVTTKAPMITAGELVLVIDDEQMVRESMADILSEVGLHVLTAADGPTGIQLFCTHVQNLKLVLLDLSMPGMSGEEVFYQLRAIDPDIPILLVSGYSESEVMERFVSTGLAGFIQKPYTMDSLLQQVQVHLLTTASTNKRTKEILQ